MITIPLFNRRQSLIQTTGLALAGVFITLAGTMSGCGEKTDQPRSTLNSGNSSSASSTRSSGESTSGSTSRGDRWAVFDQGIDNPSGVPGNADNQEVGKWTIAIATFSSPEHAAVAEQFRDEFVRISGLSAAEVSNQSDRSILHYGLYDSPTDARLIADRDRIRAIQYEGHRPFGRAFATVLNPSETGNLPQFELTRLWQMYPNAGTIYSLQIGFYTFDNERSKEKARRTAEELVTRLRSEGEPAFYYHGPTMSVVTVGAFFENAIDPEFGIISGDVRTLKEEFPYNLGNGKQMIQTQTLPSGQKIRHVQESFLISVPKS